MLRIENSVMDRLDLLGSFAIPTTETLLDHYIFGQGYRRAAKKDLEDTVANFDWQIGVA